MSTDYYLLKNVCPHCGKPEKEMQIGRSSSGWCFGLRVIPQIGVNTLEDWIKLFNDPDNRIKSEYGVQLDAQSMVEIITERRSRSGEKPDWWKPDWWYKDNQAIKGPNGLVRHRIDGKFVVGHGEGTWDYIFDSGNFMDEEW